MAHEQALPRAAGSLLEDFRSRRPIRAWSLIVTVIGDAVTPRGGEIWLGSLTQMLALAGIDGGTVRTAVSRLTSEGWLERRRAGRNSFYALSGEGRALFGAASRRVYGEPLLNWSGRWRLGVLANPGSRAGMLGRLRTEGFGELAAGVVVAPAFGAAVGPDLGSDEDVMWMEASASPAVAARIAGFAWRLEPVAARYRHFLALFEPVDAAFGEAAGMPDADAFLIRMLLIHDFRRIVLRDPLLPQAVLPADWPGRDARRLTGSVYRKMLVASERWLDRVGRSSDGPLPPPDRAFMARFGGLSATIAADRSTQSAAGSP